MISPRDLTERVRWSVIRPVLWAGAIAAGVRQVQSVDGLRGLKHAHVPRPELALSFDHFAGQQIPPNARAEIDELNG